MFRNVDVLLFNECDNPYQYGIVILHLVSQPGGTSQQRLCVPKTRTIEFDNLEHHTTDGSTFIKTLAKRNAEAWRRVRDESDRVKQLRAADANLRVNAKAVLPFQLQVGDWVWLKHGDDKQVRALRRGGSPWKRRYEVVEFRCSLVGASLPGIQVQCVLMFRDLKGPR